jgi:hypothetical protein
MDNITEQEDKIFDSMVGQFPKIFKGRLYRDGVPEPGIYWQQPVRVLFVFREANFGNDPTDWDMRKQVRDPWFQGRRNKRPEVNGWWNRKVASFGHAVVHALGSDKPSAYEDFQEWIKPDRDGFRTHRFLFPFGFMQIKKVGGGGNGVASTIEDHVKKFNKFLEQQMTLYKPRLIIACGRGNASPARLLNRYVFPVRVGEPAGNVEHTGRYTWWRFSEPAWPAAMLEFNHPSARGASTKKLHADLVAAVREIASSARLNP